MSWCSHIPSARLTRPIAFAVALLCLPVSATAEPVDFVRDVQPILANHCYGCHGEDRQRSGLRLDVKSEAFKGGELYEASILAGNASESPLVQFVADEDADLTMPPGGEPLSEKDAATLTRWVEEGAVWPDGVDPVTLEDPLDHWSFQPISSPPLPQTVDSDWPREPIDHFVLHKLEEAGLRPAPEADRAAWLRRVSFDLTGLPPTPEQLTAFVNDTSELAFERVVDELLQSPRYGERWAQHWLDVVRYADTHGFEVNTERPNAWPYRDYVISAFNDDIPYDEFIREQIVGDALGADAATGFLVTASVLLPGQIGKDAASMRLARQDSLDEIVVNLSQTFLGLTVGCARCHDHKFDPISQQDYYAMQAFVAGVEYKDRELPTPEQEKLRENLDSFQSRLAEVDRQLARLAPLANAGSERPMINARHNVERIRPVKAKRVRFTIRETNNLEPCLDELEVFNTDGANVALASGGTTLKSSGDTVSTDRHELRFINDGRYGNSRSWMSDEVGKGWVELEFSTEHPIDRVEWGRDRKGKYDDRLATDYVIEVAGSDGEWRVVADSSDRQPFDSAADMPTKPTVAGLDPPEATKARALIREREELEAKTEAAEQVRQIFAGTFREPDEIRFLTRGDPEQPKQPVAPAVPATLGSLQLTEDAAEQQRRRALADWIASPENPLTARVIVNRLWQGHFGRGLVETANDFGRSGSEPTHPELLDWLAAEFIRSGWSIKHLHQLIVLSATYRQSSHGHGDASVAERQDTDVELLWRFPSRRLEAEAIRDSMLAVSGQLDLHMNGRGFDLFDKRGGLTGFTPIESFEGEGLRRMIYAHKVRRERDGVFGAFDCPDAGQSTPRRRESTTPIQALNLFNSRFTLDRADALAARVKSEAGDDVTRQIRRVYQLALSREANDRELNDAETVVQSHGLATLCRVVFNSNEFLFVP